MREKAPKINYFVCSTPNKPIVYVLHGSNGDLLIDTGLDITVDEINDWLDENGFDIKWIFLTHGHYDHVFNAKFFKEKYNAKVMLHQGDRDFYYGKDFQELWPTDEKYAETTRLANIYTREITIQRCEIDYFLTDNDTQFLRELGFDADIVMLPGHTAGSMAVKCGHVLYCGDACSAIGGDYFTSIFGSNLEKIYESEKKIFSLNPIIIAPGHGKLIINEKAFPPRKKKQ